MRLVVIVFLVLIVASLGSALMFLFKDRGDPEVSRRMAKALALRVGLSITLFMLLMGGYYFGLLTGRL
ncbi:MAG: twin transmembrane helix small protein [Sterolibacteriaceae bacterium]|nr:twin transmembrane helix small protein [Candidatus Methylophosphatis haderslevensis]